MTNNVTIPSGDQEYRAKFFFSPANVVAYHTLLEAVVDPVRLKIFFGAAICAIIIPPTIAAEFPSSGPTVPGSFACIRWGGQAAAPERAPLVVKRAIWAANQLRSKPYRYGGGHHSFHDRGYDCSGTISYALGAAGLLKSPMSSADFRRFGQRGRGKWITVYARDGHTFAIIAGLRLDTTPYLTAHDRWAPAWYSSVRAPSGFEARHPVGL